MQLIFYISFYTNKIINNKKIKTIGLKEGDRLLERDLADNR